MATDKMLLFENVYIENQITYFDIVINIYVIVLRLLHE